MNVTGQTHLLKAEQLNGVSGNNLFPITVFDAVIDPEDNQTLTAKLNSLVNADSQTRLRDCNSAVFIDFPADSYPTGCNGKWLPFNQEILPELALFVSNSTNNWDETDPAYTIDYTKPYVKNVIYVGYTYNNVYCQYKIDLRNSTDIQTDLLNYANWNLITDFIFKINAETTIHISDPVHYESLNDNLTNAISQLLQNSEDWVSLATSIVERQNIKLNRKTVIFLGFVNSSNVYEQYRGNFRTSTDTATDIADENNWVKII